MHENGDFTVLGLAGSLRRRSYNRALLRAAADLAPGGIFVDVFEVARIPLYDAELDESLGGGPYPDGVRELRGLTERAHALLLAVPEYNWGPSGVTKNAIDWLSRPAGASPLAGKPVALMGASPGPAGTGRAQLQLHQVLLSTNSLVLQRPIVQIGGAARRFDDELRLVDEEVSELLVEQLEALVDWTRRVAGGPLAHALGGD